MDNILVMLWLGNRWAGGLILPEDEYAFHQPATKWLLSLFVSSDEGLGELG